MLVDNSLLLNYAYTDDLVKDVKVIIETAQKTFFRLQQEFKQALPGESS